MQHFADQCAVIHRSADRQPIGIDRERADRGRVECVGDGIENGLAGIGVHRRRCVGGGFQPARCIGACRAVADPLLPDIRCGETGCIVGVDVTEQRGLGCCFGAFCIGECGCGLNLCLLRTCGRCVREWSASQCVALIHRRNGRFIDQASVIQATLCAITLRAALDHDGCAGHGYQFCDWQIG